MPNIALVLKNEINRLVRKAVRTETAILRKSSAAHRTEIADLKRRVTVAERQTATSTT